MMLHILLAFVMLLIFDGYGYYVNRKFFNAKAMFNIPIGFVFVLAFFQIISFPLLFLHGNFLIVMYCYLPLILFGYGLIIYNNYQDYFKLKVSEFKNSDYILYFILSLIVFIILYILTVSEIDQLLYSSQITSTLMTNTIYYNNGMNTIEHVPNQLHELESYGLFNAMWMRLFNADVIEYIMGVFRIIEAFVIVGMLGLVNQYYNQNRKSGLILFVCGLLGLNILSSTYFSVDDYVILFGGMTGTIYMFTIMAPLVLLYFKVDDNKVLYYLLMVLTFSYAITYTFIPVLILIGLIISMIEKNNKIFFLTVILTSFYLMFYYPKFIYLSLLLAVIIITIVMYKFFKDKIIIAYIVYGLTMFGMVIYGGVEHLFGMNGNLWYYYTLPVLYIYSKIKDSDKNVIKFVCFFLVFNIVFSSMNEEREFAIMIINTRSSVFLMIPMMLIVIISEYRLVRYFATFIAISYVSLYTLVGSPKLDLRNIQEAVYDYKLYGSRRSMIIGNDDQEQLMEYPFEVNSDIYLYDQEPFDKFVDIDDSHFENFNKYIGVTNIYYEPQLADYCVDTTDCYMLVEKFYEAEDGTVRFLSLDPSEYLMQTNKYYLIDVTDLKSQIDKIEGDKL